MRIAVLGSGGTGGYFGGRWAAAGLDVTLIARGEHLAAMQDHGLRIESPLGDATVPVRAVPAHEATGPFDLVVVAIRVWQVQASIDVLRGLVGRDTAVVGVQNGVEAAEVLGEAVDPKNLLGGTCRIISVLAEPGVIRHVGADPVLLLGELGGGLSERARSFAAALDLGSTAGVVASDDIGREIWRKFLFFSPVSGVGSVTRSPIGAFRAVPESRALLVSAIREVQSLTSAEGVDLPPEGVARTVEFIDTLPHTGTTSLQRDLEAGRRTELEALAGAVCRLGRRHGIPTPVHDFIYAALLPLELRARGALPREP